jgi:hypothetical protein
LTSTTKVPLSSSNGLVVTVPSKIIDAQGN